MCFFSCYISFVFAFNIGFILYIGSFQVFFSFYLLFYLLLLYFLFILFKLSFHLSLKLFFIFYIKKKKKTLTESTGHKFSVAISQPRTSTHACSMERTPMGKAVGGFESNKTFSPKKLVIRPRVFKSPIPVWTINPLVLSLRIMLISSFETKMIKITMFPCPSTSSFRYIYFTEKSSQSSHHNQGIQ